MRQTFHFALAWCLALGVALVATAPAGAASQPTTCTGTLTIFTTSTGAVRTIGNVSLFQNSGVAGQYASGPLAGDNFVGAQDIILDATSKQSELHGSYVVTAPGNAGTLTVRYVGHADLTTGKATGTFVANQGTGSLAGFTWTGSISAQLVSLTPPTFVSTDTGVCVSTQV